MRLHLFDSIPGAVREEIGVTGCGGPRARPSQDRTQASTSRVLPGQQACRGTSAAALRLPQCPSSGVCRRQGRPHRFSATLEMLLQRWVVAEVVHINYSGVGAD